MSSQNLPKVSIVSITYNHDKYIKQVLDSFLAQKTEFKFEIIVADDASTDDTQKIIQQYAEKHPDVIKPILRKQNIGIQPNCIEAFQKAKGDYIAFCEGDDYWTVADKLQKQVDMMEADRNMALCFHPVKIAFEDSHQKNYVYPEAKPELSVEKLLERNFIQSNSVLYRRQKYDSLPDDIMPLDWYLHLYHAQFGSIGFIDEVMSVYRRHAGGIWWDATGNIDKIWGKYGLAHIALYHEFLKLYGKNQKYKKIIADLVINGFSALKRVDTDLFSEAMSKFPDCAEIYIDNLREQVDKLDAHAKEQAKIIEHYQNELKLAKNDAELLRKTLDRTVSYKLRKIVKRKNKI